MAASGRLGSDLQTWAALLFEGIYGIVELIYPKNDLVDLKNRLLT